MKVLHVWKDHAPRFFDVSHRLCLDTAGVHSRLVTQYLIESSEGSEPEIRSVRVVPVQYLYPQNFFARIFRLGERIADERRFHALIEQELRDNRPDVIHCHFGTVAAEIHPQIVASKIPTIVSLYGNDVSESLRSVSIVDSYRALSRAGCYFTVLCDEAKERLNRIECNVHRVELFNLAPGVESYPYIERSDKTNYHWITAARFVEKKGYVLQLNALEKIFSTFPEARCTWIGYGPLESEIRQTVDRMGFSNRVKIVADTVSGKFDETFREALKDASLFVLPSVTAASGDDEGGPALTMVKAQASGLATVCTHFPGSERSLIEGKTGWYCDTTASSLAQSVIEAFSDFKLLANYGRNAEDWVRNEFSLNSYRIRLMKLYDTAIKQ